MKLKIGITILLAMLMSCCGAHKKDKYNTFDGINVPAGNLLLVFKNTTTQDERRWLTESALRQLSFFENDWGSLSKPSTVYYYKMPHLPSEDDYAGLCYIPDGPIHLIMGDHYESSVLYHELVHLNHPTGDADHEDERWPFWRARQSLISGQIISEREELNIKISSYEIGE